MEEKYLCRICLKVPKNAVECVCKVNFCSDCYTSISLKCPVCEKENFGQCNHDLRSQILKCKNCPEMVFTQEAYKKEHSKICLGTKITCKACGIQGDYNFISLHLYKDHYFQILSIYAEPLYRMSR